MLLHRLCVRWYDGRRRTLDVTSGTTVWYRIGQPVLPVRWVLVRDPAGKLEPRAYFSTCPRDRARDIVTAFIKHWTIETTFEGSRAHLGLATQRQWTDWAIERTTPCLLGLYSVVALLAHALHPDGEIPIHTTAWYHKSQATFADVLAAVRRHCCGTRATSGPVKPDAHHGIARHIVSRPPVDAGMPLGTARPLGVPIPDKDLQIVALSGLMLPAIGAEGGPNHIDLMLGLGRHQEVGIDIATVEQVSAGQQITCG
jgi:hypothetical protein